MEYWSADQYNFWIKKKSKPTKYRNVRCIYDGIKFASKKEMQRYCELKILESVGAISYLKLQPSFMLQEKQEGIRAIKYIGDFSYHEESSDLSVIEDVKSIVTKKNPVYRMKKKMFMAKYPEYDFREV